MPSPSAPSDVDNIDRGNFLEGCAVGFLVQIGFGILAIALPTSSGGRTSAYLFSSFALTQWVLLIPMIRREESRGHSQTSRGLITAGIVGLIVGCLAFLYAAAF